jgi:hypothetical protein
LWLGALDHRLRRRRRRFRSGLAAGKDQHPAKGEREGSGGFRAGGSGEGHRRPRIDKESVRPI